MSLNTDNDEQKGAVAPRSFYSLCPPVAGVPYLVRTPDEAREPVKAVPFCKKMIGLL